MIGLYLFSHTPETSPKFQTEKKAVLAILDVAPQLWNCLPLSMKSIPLQLLSTFKN